MVRLAGNTGVEMGVTHKPESTQEKRRESY
jgi:hypothetical protein